MFRPRLNDTGDTIIEVLLSVAIIGGILAISYATMNRNLVNLRNNQERTEATKLAQGQIEALIAKWKDDTTSITSEGTDGFCINDIAQPAISLGGSAPNTDPNADNLTGDYGACRTGFYSYGIKASNLASNTYNAYVRWERIGGGIGEVVYTHRVTAP